MSTEPTFIAAPMRGIPTPTQDQHVPVEHLERVEQLQTRVREAFGELIEPGQRPGDFEDCVEELFRVDAALQAWPEDRRTLVGKGFHSLEKAQQLGFQDGSRFWFSIWFQAPFRSAPARIAQRWDLVPGVVAAAGRPVATVDADPRSLLGTVREMAQTSADGSVWVKSMASAKAGIWRVAPDPDPDSFLGLVAHQNRDDAGQIGTGCDHEHDPVIDGLWGDLLRFEEQRDHYLVSAHVPMRHEYRVFVVDGVPVCGAGCLVERTPLDHYPAHGPFDPFTRADRYDHDEPAQARPGLVAELVEAARPVAAALRAAGCSHCVVDMARGPAGPVLVEVNGLENAGLYACDPYAVAAAMAASQDPQTLEMKPQGWCS